MCFLENIFLTKSTNFNLMIERRGTISKTGFLTKDVYFGDRETWSAFLKNVFHADGFAGAK